MGVLIPLLIIFFACLFIWRACDGFEVASEYIGRNLSEGVRGGTINAVSSSLPELLTTLIALFILSVEHGFSIGIGTTAGSALFNGMIIPAACILTVVGRVIMGRKVNSVNVSLKVLRRDGLSLIVCEVILIVIISGTALYWWQGLILIVMYLTYLSYMLLSMKRIEVNDDEEEEEEEEAPKTAIGKLFYCLSLGPLLDLERLLVREHHREQIKSGEWNGWPLLSASTVAIGVACWMLVKACEWLGTGSAENPGYELFGEEFQGLGMPAMFVAVIFASMATSVPDTVISIRDARDGDYDDAVANALGSNIFDICFALGLPLFMYTLIYGPIRMDQEVVAQSGELLFLLLSLTIIGFLVYYIGPRGTTESGTRYVAMRRGKAFLLLAIYVAFAIYVVARGAEVGWAVSFSEFLRGTVDMLPSMDTLLRSSN